jgi:hypothetical protein
MKTFTEWLLKEDNTQAIDYLKKIESAGYLLLIHQTYADTAMNIINSQSFKTGGNASGTLGKVNTDSLLGLVNALINKKAGKNYLSGLVHRDSDAILIMAIPRFTIIKGEKIEIKRTDDLDSVLGDLNMEGKLKGMEIPNNYILGAWIIEGSERSKQYGSGLRISKNFDPKKGPI